MTNNELEVFQLLLGSDKVEITQNCSGFSLSIATCSSIMILSTYDSLHISLLSPPSAWCDDDGVAQGARTSYDDNVFYLQKQW